MWFHELVDIAGGILTIAACVLVLAAIPVAFALWRLVRQIGDEVARARRDAAPLMRDATTAAHEVAALTTALRGDAANVHATIGEVTDRVRAGVRAVEERVREIDALARVAQEEIEGVVLSAVAAARGVRAGANVLGGLVGGMGSAGRSPRARPPVPDEPSRAAGEGGDETMTYDSGEFGDADERWGEVGDGGPRPRVRSRRGGR